MSNPNETEVADWLFAKLHTIRKDAGYLVNVDPAAVVFGSLSPASGADVGPRIGVVPRGTDEAYMPGMRRECRAKWEITIECAGETRRDAYARCVLLRRSINRLLIQNQSMNGFAFMTDVEVSWDHLEIPEAARWAMSRTVTVHWYESVSEV